MATTYLSKTPSSDGSEKKWTLSVWFKGGSLKEGMFFTYTGTSSARSEISLGNNQELFVAWNPTGSSWHYSNTSPTRRFRDPNAWYHLVVGVDTTQATASNRVKIYINGEQAGSELIDTYPAQDSVTGFNKSGYSHQIGRYAHSGGNYFDGQMAHMHWIDGTQYAASDFGETDSTTGIWKPKTSPTGINYGTNGFFLKFENSANMGLDSSGQGNNYSVSGGTMTQLIDTPSNVFATLNPLDTGLPGTTLNLANGNNTTMNTSGYGDYGVRSTLGASSGKYYWEAKYTTGNCTGIQPMDTELIFDMFGSTPEAHVYGIQRYNDSSTNFFSNTTFTSQNTAAWGGITSGDIIGYALDLDNGKIFCSKNGNFKDLSGNTGDPVNGTYPTFTIADTDRVYGAYVELRTNNDNGTKMNFGNGYFGTTAVTSAQNPDDGIGIFEYDVPAGYRALCTKSLNAEEYS